MRASTSRVSAPHSLHERSSLVPGALPAIPATLTLALALATAPQPEVVARHTTEYNIKCIRFSAYEEDQLVTCGRDNVRTYRLKGNQLRGVTVRMGGPDNKVRG